MNPLHLCQLLMQQLGRVPTLGELMAAMGAPSVGMGAEAGAEDGPLTALLRQHDAGDQALVRMMLLGGGQGGSGAMLQGPQQGPMVAGGRQAFFLPSP